MKLTDPTSGPAHDRCYAAGMRECDLVHHFETLDVHTIGMSHPARLEFLALQFSCMGDDEETAARHRDDAWLIIEAWEEAKGGRNRHVAEPVRSLINGFATTFSTPAPAALFTDPATERAMEDL